ncbi:MAG: YggT family protein [Holosporales bacterium]|nr:YggT family protein [Holosporales bacterium]
MLILILAHLIISVLQVIEYVLFGYIILGWFVLFGALKNRDGFFFRIYIFLMTKTEPLFSVLRRFIPPIMGLDFSALLVFVLLHIAKSLVIALAGFILRLTH